jgi:hypothetical protein
MRNLIMKPRIINIEANNIIIEVEYERSTLFLQWAESVRSMLIGMGVSPMLVTAAGDPRDNNLDGRTELLVQPIVEN